MPCLVPYKVTDTRWLPHLSARVRSLLRNFKAYHAHVSTLSHTNPKGRGSGKDPSGQTCDGIRPVSQGNHKYTQQSYVLEGLIYNMKLNYISLHQQFRWVNLEILSLIKNVSNYTFYNVHLYISLNVSKMFLIGATWALERALSSRRTGVGGVNNRVPGWFEKSKAKTYVV